MFDMYTKACVYAVYLELTKKWMATGYELPADEEAFRGWAAPTLFLKYRDDHEDMIVIVPAMYQSIVTKYTEGK